MDLTSNAFKVKLINDYIAGKNFKLIILSANYSPSFGHDYVNDLVAHEISDPEYFRPSVALSVNLFNNQVNLSFPDTNIYLEGPVTSRYAVLYEEGSNDGSSLILRVLEHRDSEGVATTFRTENGNLTIKSPTAGGVLVLKDE